MDRNVNAPAKVKRYADCMAERDDLWRGADYERPVTAAVDAIVRTLRSGGRVFFFGNGGSAAQAQHLAAELCGRFMLERPGYAGIALSVDTSALTAIANDYGFERVFSRQIESLVAAGDVLVALSTSGNSANVIAGVEAGRKRAAFLVGLTGETGGKLNGTVDLLLNVPSSDPQRIQEAHITIGHIVCSLIENSL